MRLYIEAHSKTSTHDSGRYYCHQCHRECHRRPVAPSRGASPQGNHTHPRFSHSEAVSQLKAGVTPPACRPPRFCIALLTRTGNTIIHRETASHTCRPRPPERCCSHPTPRRVVLSSTSHIPTRSHDNVNITPPPPHTSVEHTDTSVPKPQARAGPMSTAPQLRFPLELLSLETPLQRPPTPSALPLSLMNPPPSPL